MSLPHYLFVSKLLLVSSSVGWSCWRIITSWLVLLLIITVQLGPMVSLVWFWTPPCHPCGALLGFLPCSRSLVTSDRPRGFDKTVLKLNTLETTQTIFFELCITQTKKGNQIIECLPEIFVNRITFGPLHQSPLLKAQNQKTNATFNFK